MKLHKYNIKFQSGADMIYIAISMNGIMSDTRSVLYYKRKGFV